LSRQGEPSPPRARYEHDPIGTVFRRLTKCHNLHCKVHDLLLRFCWQDDVCETVLSPAIAACTGRSIFSSQRQASDLFDKFSVLVEYTRLSRVSSYEPAGRQIYLGDLVTAYRKNDFATFYLLKR
jgi:hypothetical protein